MNKINSIEKLIKVLILTKKHYKLKISKILVTALNKKIFVYGNGGSCR